MKINDTVEVANNPKLKGKVVRLDDSLVIVQFVGYTYNNAEDGHLCGLDGLQLVVAR